MPMNLQAPAIGRPQVTMAVAAAALLAFSPVSAGGRSANQTKPTSDDEMAEALSQSSMVDRIAANPIEPSSLTAEELVEFLRAYRSDPVISDIVEQEIAKLTQPGEAVPGWQESGVDILAILAAKDGGIAGNILHERSDDLHAFTDFSGSLRPKPSGYTSYVLEPIPEGSGSNIEERFFADVAPGLWIEISQARSQLGNALCYSGLYELTLHSARPHTEWTEDDLFMFASIFGAVEQLAAEEMCIVYDRDDSGAVTSMVFTPDGRAIDGLNADPIVGQIVPAKELQATMEAAGKDYGGALPPRPEISLSEPEVQPSASPAALLCSCT